MSDLRIDYGVIAPELILAGASMLILVVSVFIRSRRGSLGYLILGPPTVALLAIASAFAYLVVVPGRGTPEPYFARSFTLDGYAVLFKLVFLASSFLVVLLSIDYSRRMSNPGEFFGLIVAATAAMCFMASATDLVTLYVSIEFLSLTSYVLAGYLKQEPRSNEAAMKYFLYGAACSATMLYGMSLLYGMVGSTNYTDIAASLRANGGGNILLLAASMILVGFGFKISMVPFHQWAPDTYEGAPTPVTAFLSVAPKAAGFAVLIRMFIGVVPVAMTHWPGVLGVVSALTMTIGNLTAIPQTSAKRMLAYSSIAQAGYVLIGLAAWTTLSDWALPGALVYLITYFFMNLGAFTVVIAIENRTGSEEIHSYAGMAQRAPWLAAAMAFFMLSLAGLPPTAGFVGKFLVFGAAIGSASHRSWLAWLVVIGVLNSAISLYYYFNVVKIMFFRPAQDTTPISVSPTLKSALAITLVGTMGILIFAGPVFTFAKEAMAYAFR